jgi:hypothetical protein
VLLLHEVHRVRGATEDQFEAAFRDRWMPDLAAGDDARLLYFMQLAHGSGRAYTAVTVTGVRDGAAWERVARSIQDGPLRSWAHDVDQLRHSVTAKVLVPVPWSPPVVEDLDAVPTEPAEHPLTIFMEDTAWPHDGMLDDYLEKARTHYAPSLTESRQEGRAILELLAVFQTAFGSGRRSEVVLWQRILDHSRLLRLLETEIAPEYRGPGTWMNDALEVRDDWQSQLLRTSAWSPLS